MDRFNSSESPVATRPTSIATSDLDTHRPSRAYCSWPRWSFRCCRCANQIFRRVHPFWHTRSVHSLTTLRRGFRRGSAGKVVQMSSSATRWGRSETVRLSVNSTNVSPRPVAAGAMRPCRPSWWATSATCWQRAVGDFILGRGGQFGHGETELDSGARSSQIKDFADGHRAGDQRAGCEVIKD